MQIGAVNMQAMQAAAYAQIVSGQNVANLESHGFKPSDVTLTESSSGPQAGVRRTNGPVDLTRELLNQRSYTHLYDSNARVVKTHDDMLGTVINMWA